MMLDKVTEVETFTKEEYISHTVIYYGKGSYHNKK